MTPFSFTFSRSSLVKCNPAVGACRTQLDISLTLTPSLKEHIVEKYSNLKMGARPLKRAIQTLIEDALAEEILSGRVKSGDHVSAGFRENKVVFSVKNK